MATIISTNEKPFWALDSDVVLISFLPILSVSLADLLG
jgi:hypothetical protein